MLLRENDFIRTEGGAPLMMQNHGYLHKNADAAWKKTRIWTQLLLNKESTPTSLDDEKKQHSITDYNSNDKQSLNYGLKLIKKPNRIIRKDADRTFLTERRRQLLITILEALQTLFNDYQQTISYVSGILLLFFPAKTVFEMMFKLGRDPHYNMGGYWRSEAVDQGIDAYVLYEIIKKVNLPLYTHFDRMKVLPDTFIQKWFGGLAVQVMPIEHLIDFWTQYFKYGFRYLFKFAIALLQNLSPLLLSTHSDYKLYELLRVERKSKFWRALRINESSKTEKEMVSLFFIKVLSDTNSLGEMYNVDNIDFHKEREYAFNEYLCGRFTNAALMVTFKGFEVEEDGDDSDEFKDCENCDDGFAEVFCDECQVYLCDECAENPSGEHAVTHALKSLDLGKDTINID